MIFDILTALAWVCVVATAVILLGGLFYTLGAKRKDPREYAMSINRIFIRRVALQLAAVALLVLLLWLGNGG